MNSEYSDRQSFDLAVVGAGPGGYVAAIRAAQLGLNTVIIEKQHMGGVCLNWGCIPTKSLLKSAELYQAILKSKDYGLDVSAGEVDIAKVVKRSREVADRLSRGIDYLMDKNRITVVRGKARLIERGLLEISRADQATSYVTAPHIILATGASPRSLPGVEPDGQVIWTAKEAMTPDSLPKSLLVIGSGAIGIEFASFYQSFGSEVTVIEKLDRILPQEDREVSMAAQKSFERRGMKIFTSSDLERAQVNGSQAEVTWRSPAGVQQGVFDRVIVAAGVTANTAGLGLEQQGVELDRGQVVVNAWCETSVPGIYAIGDMTAPPWLAHKASHEAVLCVDRIAGEKNLEPIDVHGIPACTYSSPQIASVGMTEEQARQEGIHLRVGRFDLNASGKAQAIGQPEGFVKTIFDADTGELLGAHMIGPEVTELIQGYVIARKLETTEDELSRTVFAHPTMSEAMHESVLDAIGQGIHS